VNFREGPWSEGIEFPSRDEVDVPAVGDEVGLKRLAMEDAQKDDCAGAAETVERCDVGGTIGGVEGLEAADVEDGVEAILVTAEVADVGLKEVGLVACFGGAAGGVLDRNSGEVDTEDGEPKAGEIAGIRAGSATGIEDRATNPAVGDKGGDPFVWRVGIDGNCCVRQIPEVL